MPDVLFIGHHNQNMDYKTIRNIKSPRDIKGMSPAQLKEVAAEIREATVYRCSNYAGHVGPNLGDAEAVIALHYVFDAPEDKIVFDVSHQDFPHKILTGRASGFIDKSCFDSIGEYTDPRESPEYDIFYAGHTSPSISLCCGLAKARELAGDSYNIVAFIGDGSLSGGPALEGLNTAGALDANFICIVNDNQMAIAETHGSIYDNLRLLRETNGTAELNLFKAFGFDYLYVAEGNNIEALIEAFSKVKDTTRPTVVHINTQKSEGYAPAERDREKFHWCLPFDIATGEPKHNDTSESYNRDLRDFIMERHAADPRMLIISSATPDSFCLGPRERELLGNHYIDVGIAEQTAVSVMAGAARNGAKAVYAVISSFLQRAYDQLLEDWAMNPGNSLMLVDCTGVCGISDLTHLGFWDIPMITSISDIVYLAPANAEEFKAMLDWGYSQDRFKVALRIPSYSYDHADYDVDTDYSDINRYKVTHRGSTVATIEDGSLEGGFGQKNRGECSATFSPAFYDIIDDYKFWAAASISRYSSGLSVSCRASSSSLLATTSF